MDYVDRLGRLLREKFGLAATGRAETLRALAELERQTAEKPVPDRNEDPERMLHEVAGQLIPGESYFWRHPEQLEAVVERVRDLLGKYPTVSIWSAGCARGEEPYTIAIQLAEQLGPGVKSRVKLVATDLNRGAIETAKAGVYSAWSLRTATQATLQHFSKRDQGSFSLKSDFRGWVEFHHASIQDHLARTAAESVDIVLFRNVAIYFEPDALLEVHRGISRTLKKDGILVQAATDPLPCASLFLPDSVASAGTFRLRAAAKSLRPSVRPRAGKTGSGSVAIVRADAPVVGKRTAGRPAPGSAPAKPRPTEANIQSVSSSSESQGGLSAAMYVRRAQQSLDGGDHESAVADLRAALYMEPDDCLARYWYYLALSAAGQRGRALNQLQELERQLERVAPTSLLRDGRTTAGDLRAAVHEIYEALA